MTTFPTTAAEFFLWLASPAAQGLALTLGLERWPWFQQRTERFKKWSTFLGSLAWPLPTTALAFWLGLTKIEIPTTPQGWFLLVVNLMLQGVAVWVATQYGHEADPQTAVNRAKGR